MEKGLKMLLERSSLIDFSSDITHSILTWFSGGAVLKLRIWNEKYLIQSKLLQDIEMP